MSASQTLGGTTRAGRVLGPYLDKIIKNVAWRKHSHLVSACKSAIDRLEILTETTDPQSPLLGFTLPDTESVLNPLILAIESSSPKVTEPALECAFKLFSLSLLVSTLQPSNPKDLVFRILHSTCNSLSLSDHTIEIHVLRTLLSSVLCPSVTIPGDFLLHIVRTCYNTYLGSLSGTNQILAKSVLAQIMLIVFSRLQSGSASLEGHIRVVSVNGLLEFTDRNLNEGSSIQLAQNFINEVMEASQQNHPSIRSDLDPDQSMIREDSFVLFKNLCKLSMKFSSHDHSDDNILLRGKILSLELLNVVMDNADPMWQLDEMFLSAIKQYLCLSLLKNSALSVMTIFQLLCSIFMSLLLKFRSGLKSEIGIFFSMLILRVLENVLQPSFLQKMTVLGMLEKITLDSQIVIDIFVNYDCDVDAPNIFERIVNGLHKTALGPPPGSTTTLSPVQDITFRIESVKCLVSIMKSMGGWMDQQLRSIDLYQEKNSENSVLTESTLNAEEGVVSDHDLHPELNLDFSDASTFEQRRSYKIELQKGVSLFNKKPSKGIEFLINSKKIGNSPEEVATFLKNISGLNKTMIGDYLGEREDFSLKVMHAYVDSFNFGKMDFGEAIRFFLQGFRLPGEAQKIDRIMEKFAERYCKCNPSPFSSADTAYVLAYSVIMLNTDAHNNMVKDKMTKADFIRNNRGIDDGKNLPEEYLSALYDQIVRHEIKMNADSFAPQNKQANGINKLLGLDGILNLVNWTQAEEKPLGANGALIKHIQEQIQTKSGKSECVYYSVADVAILRFMVEVCWGPMLAAYSVTLDQSDDKTATSQCLQGFRHAVHVTAVMGMQTQKDAFVTTVAKFTNLHCAADMKQKNVDAVKAMISSAIEDGNFLQESWEHILTCLSRFEHLQLLGEGVPSDASFFTNGETDEKIHKSTGFPSLKKKGTLQNPAVMAVVRGGSYDSTAVKFNASGLLTAEQINNFITNLNLLDQIGSFELNHIFSHSQSLNSEAIVSFVSALCKVSMLELQSPTDPRVFSLTKIVEIAHYNMNRIRLVWSRIWSVLSEFFVSVGLSENLSVAIFVMDSLRQLAMKFLEREELANYNFQNEFLRPFVIVMQKSNSSEIRELIVRCISQMVLSRVSNVKSGWKSVFMIFTAAASDERKNIVLLAFETMEKIVREYFPYITETETVTFTDCVGCLITFTNSRFNSDVTLNAIAFLRFCAVKLAEGGLSCNEKRTEDSLHIPVVNGDALDGQTFIEKDDHVSFWVPLLTGLSKLTSDPRLAIRKSSLEVLFNILKDHGYLFSRSFWTVIFDSVILPIFKSVYESKESSINNAQYLEVSKSHGPPEQGISSTWDSETCGVAAQCLVDVFVNFFDVVRFQLPCVVSIVIGFMRSHVHGYASTGVAALVHLTSALGSKLLEDEWREIFLALKDAADSSMPGFLKFVRTMDNIDVPGAAQSYTDFEFSDHGLTNDDQDDSNLQAAAYMVSRMKSHISVQILIVQVATDLYKVHLQNLSSANITIILEMFSSVATHAHQLNSETKLQMKMQKACSILELPDPPMVHFENECYQNYLKFLQNLLAHTHIVLSSDKINIETQLVTVCKEILQMYLKCGGQDQFEKRGVIHWIVPLGTAKKEELSARTSLVVSALRVLSGLERESFKRYISHFFPLLVELVRSEHSSGEVQLVLSGMFESCIGPIVMD